MNEALGYLYEIYFAQLKFYFEDSAFFPGVTIGYVVLSVIVISIMIALVTNIPKGIDIDYSDRGDKK